MIRLRSVLKILLLAAFFYACWLMLELTLPYTALKPGIDFLKTKAAIYHILHWRLSFYTHVFSALIVLVTGFFQFSGYVIRRWPKVHRITGYIYVVDVLLITGPAALVMSFYANGGWPARISFILQSLAWLFYTAMALSLVRKKKFLQHGNWMLLSYSLTLAAITLRLYKAGFSFYHSDIRPRDMYVIISWASWIPNLFVGWLLIRSGFIKRLLKKRSASSAVSIPSK